MELRNFLARRPNLAAVAAVSARFDGETPETAGALDKFMAEMIRKLNCVPDTRTTFGLEYAAHEPKHREERWQSGRMRRS